MHHGAEFNPAAELAVLIADVEVESRLPKGDLPMDLGVYVQGCDQPRGTIPEGSLGGDQGYLIAIDDVAQQAGRQIGQQPEKTKAGDDADTDFHKFAQLLNEQA